MALPWVRLDTQIPTNHKIIDLASDGNYRACFAYVSSLAIVGQHETDGFIKASWLPFIHATKGVADALVAVGLWREIPGGWEIPDWAEYQPTSEQSRQRRERAQKAAKARWEKKTGPAKPASLKVVNDDR